MDLDKKFLDKLNIDDSTEWIIYINQATSGFFKWLQNNITDDNFLSLEEIQDYAALECKNLLLSDEEVGQIFAATEELYPTIFSNDINVKINNLKEKIKVEETFHASLKKIQQKLDVVAEECTHRIAQAETKISRADTEYVGLLESALEVGQNLETIESNNLEAYEALKTLYVTKQEPPLLMYQMPIYRLQTNCTEFIDVLEQYIVKEPLFSQNPNNSIVTLESDLQIAKDNWLQTHRQLLEIEQKLASLNSMSDVVRVVMPQTLSDLQNDLTDLELLDDEDDTDIEDLELEIIELMKLNLQTDVDIWLEPHIRHMNEMAKQRVNALKEVIATVNSFAATLTVVWICIELDKKRISQPLNCSEPQEAQANHLRIEWMSNLIEQEPNQIEEMRQRVVIAFQSLLNVDYNRYSINELVEMYNDFQAKVAVKRSNLIAPHKNFEAMLSSFRDAEQQLKSSVYDGPVNRPQFDDPMLRVRIQRLITYNESIKHDLKQLNSEFQKFLRSMNEDEFKKNQYKLWSWFLTEPHKMVDAIRKLKESSNMGTSTNKIISGIRRQML